MNLDEALNVTRPGEFVITIATDSSELRDELIEFPDDDVEIWTPLSKAIGSEHELLIFVVLAITDKALDVTDKVLRMIKKHSKDNKAKAKAKINGKDIPDGVRKLVSENPDIAHIQDDEKLKNDKKPAKIKKKPKQ